PVLRVVPPLGPEPPEPSVASFSVTPERAACVRLPTETRFAELSAVRMPLAAGASGTEARVLLWQSAGPEDSTPFEPLAPAASDPVSLSAGPEDWRTFSFAKPVVPPKDVALWAVLTVNRGAASMTFAD